MISQCKDTGEHIQQQTQPAFVLDCSLPQRHPCFADNKNNSLLNRMFPNRPRSYRHLCQRDKEMTRGGEKPDSAYEEKLAYFQGMVIKHVPSCSSGCLVSLIQVKVRSKNVLCIHVCSAKFCLCMTSSFVFYAGLAWLSHRQSYQVGSKLPSQLI